MAQGLASRDPECQSVPLAFDTIFESLTAEEAR